MFIGIKPSHPERDVRGKWLPCQYGLSGCLFFLLSLYFCLNFIFIVEFVLSSKKVTQSV